MKHSIVRGAKEQSGAPAIEYALIIIEYALIIIGIAAAILLSIQALGNELSAVFAKITALLP